VVIVASLDAGEGVGFGDVPDLAFDLFDGSGVSRVRPPSTTPGRSRRWCRELYLRGEDWKFRAVGQGWDTGLAGLATDYGIAVAEPADDRHADAEDPTASTTRQG
jgi:stress response protein SCP2